MNISKKEYDKIYNQKNKSKKAIKAKEYRKNNKKKAKLYSIKYIEAHKEEKRIYDRAYKKKKRETCPQFKLRNSISNIINIYLKKIGSAKNRKSMLQYLSYSIQELKNHLEKQFEPWMTWNNRGTYRSKIWNDNDLATWTWQIDHIIPQSDLPYTSMEDENFKKCWALDNLRPLNSKQNIFEGNQRVRHNKVIKNDF